jgi:ubiquitin C-terminal hydrolase
MSLSRKLPPAVEESAFIYQVFGGKLRSQLKCYSCNATSNNYEACLDLSVDLTNKAKTVEQALANFTKVDIIGSDDPNNKYKCDA